MKVFKKSLLAFLMIVGMLLSPVVFAATDNSALILARDAVNQAIADQLNDMYDADSYAAFETDLAALGGIAAVDAMIAAGDLAEQTAVDQMTSDLNAILSHLVTDDTFTTIQAEYWSMRGNADPGTYTTRSLDTFTAEMDRIKYILDDPRSGETIISGLSVDIASAEDLLIPLASAESLTGLQALLDQAEAVYLDGSDYIPSTFQAFQTDFDGIDVALNTSIGFTVQQVLDNADASQIEVDEAVAEIEYALSLLTLKPDKTILIQNYDDAVALDKSIYTLASRTEFVDDLASINAVITDEEALEADVQQAITDLAAMYQVLVLKGDPSDLQASIDALMDYDFDGYTPNSILLFDDEINRISEAMVDEDTDVAMMTQLESDFADAFDLLVLRADTTELTLLNNQAIVAYYEDKSLYTASSYALFKQAVLDYGTYLYVNQVIADPNVSQAEIDQLEGLIQTALDLLDVIVDNTDLLSLYAILIDIDSDLYTPESIDAFEAECLRIHEVIIGKELSQTVHDQIEIDISTAPELLVERADKTVLSDLISSLEDRNAENYSSTSYANFQRSMNQANLVLEDDNASQAEVDAMITSLSEAVDLLQSKPGEIVIIAHSDPFNVNGYLTLGTSSILAYVSSDDSILVVDSSGDVVGLEYGTATVSVVLSNGDVETLEFLVKANVHTVTFVLACSLPALSVAAGFGMLYLKPKHFLFLKKLMFWKKG